MNMFPDRLTLLISQPDKPAAKLIGRGPDGHLTTKPIKPSFLYDVREVEISSLETLGASLSAIESQPAVCVVRGQLLPGRPRHGVRRLIKPKGEEPANFVAAARRYCMLDIDDVPLPDSMRDINTNVLDLVAAAVGYLPKEFQASDCWFQFSASMGIKTDKIRVHLWYWLSRPVSDRELKSWLSEYPVDKAVFNPVQPHYTAKPILDVGISDPMPDRSGFYRAGQAQETVEVPDGLPSQAAHRHAHQRGTNAGNAGATDIVRDPDTGLVVDGRRLLLLQASNQAMSEAVQAGGAEISAEVVGARAWEVFSAEADISDGKWSLDDAVGEAAKRLDELRAGTYDFTSRQRVTTLYPAAAPFVSPEFVSREEGMVALDAELAKFFSSATDGSPRLALRVTMGAGKTRQTVSWLKQFLASQFGKRVEIYVPRHDLAEEYVKAFRSGEHTTARVVHLFPRDRVLPGTDQILCKRGEYIAALTKAKRGIFQNACRSNKGDHCVFFDDCQYIAQFRDPDLTEANGNVIRIGVHEYLGLPRNPMQHDPDVVVIDEAFLNVLIKERSLNTRDFQRELRSPRHPNLSQIIANALMFQRPLLSELRKAGVQPTHLSEVDLSHLAPPVPFNERGSHSVNWQDAGLQRSLSMLIEVLQEELNLPDRAEAERVVFDFNKNEIVVIRMNQPQVPDGVPLLILDATADQTLLEECVGPVDFKRIDIEQRAFTTQVYDRTGSNAFWNGPTAPLEELVAVLNVWAELGEIPLVVSHKALADRLRNWHDLDPRVLINHFQNLRGSNAAEGASVAFITGRNSPPATAIDKKARAIFWAIEPPLQHDNAITNTTKSISAARLPMSLKGYLQSEINPHPQSGVEVETFSDDRIEAIHRQSRDAETAQAIARLRLVHAQRLKQVYLLSNLPVEFPIDSFAEFDELMPDQLELELIKNGNIPLTPLGIMKMRPDIADTPERAAKLLQRSRMREPSRLRLLPPFARSGLCIVEFKARNNGRTRKHQHLFSLPGQVVDRVPIMQIGSHSSGIVPFREWVRYLENGDERNASTGWVELIHPRLIWVPSE